LLPDTLTSPLVIGEGPGIAEPIEPGGFHGCFWVAPRTVLDQVGSLDDRFKGAFWEDDDYLERLRQAGVATRQIRSVCVRHVGGLTMLKIPEQAKEWYERNERQFQEKWGWIRKPALVYRRARGNDTWHSCKNCANWPTSEYDEQQTVPASGECAECRSKRERGRCTF
jgi:GT2 family glycosyltransferase